MAKTWITEYANGVRSEVRVYRKTRKGRHATDRIRLTITPVEGEPFSVYMHALEAVDIAAALGHAVAEAMSLGLPLLSRSDDG